VQSSFLLRPFSVDEYHRLVSANILTEDDAVELLEGWIIYKMPRDPQHDTAIALAQRAIGMKLPPAWHYRGQSAVTTSDSEPEPDGAVLAGHVRAYAQSHPHASDI